MSLVLLSVLVIKRIRICIKVGHMVSVVTAIMVTKYDTNINISIILGFSCSLSQTISPKQIPKAQPSYVNFKNNPFIYKFFDPDSSCSNLCPSERDWERCLQDKLIPISKLSSILDRRNVSASILSNI